MVKMYQNRPSTYSEFLEAGTEIEDELNYLKKALPNMFEQRLPQLCSESWCVLDIGCAEGTKSKLLIEFLTGFGKVYYTALEPAENQLQKFRLNIHADNLVYIKLINAKWENYQPNQKYDFIYCSHAFYYIQNWEDSINKMLNSLNENGKILIAMQKENNISYLISKEFSNLYDGEREEIHHADELTDFLNKNNIQFEMIEDTNQFNVSEMKKQSPAGIRLIEFFIDKSWDELTEQNKDRMISFVSEFPDTFINHVGFIWIGKQ